MKNPPRNGEGDRAKRGGGGPRLLQTPIKQVKRARKLRREMSLPEVPLWDALRKKALVLRFRRQFPTNRTVDFACLSHRLIVEVDGEQHGYGDQRDRDKARDAIMKQEGFTVMRIAARDVLKDLGGVVSGIVARCNEVGPLHHAPHGPPPRAGEDLR